MPAVVGYLAGQAAIGLTFGMGLTATQTAMVAMAASYAASNLAAGLMGSEGDDIGGGILTNKASANAAVPVIYGSRKVGGTRVYLEVNGDDNEYLHQVIVLAEGEIDSINNVYLNDIDSTDTRFSGLVTIVKKTGADNQAAVTSSEISNLPSSWTSAHKLSGMAYIYVRMKWDKDAFPRGVPLITCDVDGKKTYDPRTSATTFNHNPALALRDYLTNTRYGRSIPTSQIDDAAIIAAANYCDATVTKGGVSSARYTCDGLVNITQTSLDIINKLLSSCRGFLVFTGGVYKLVLDKPESAVFTFSEDNIVGQWSIGLGNKNTTYNRITATFFNPDRNWQQDQAVIDSSSLRTDDNGLVLERQTMLPFTSNIYTAQQIATINLNQSRQGVTCQFTATIEALRVEVGDVVYVKHDTPGWDTLNSNQGKLFRVIAMSLQANDEVAVTCREYDSTVYDFGTINTVDATPNTALPDPHATEAMASLTVTSSAATQVQNDDRTNLLTLQVAWTNASEYTTHYEVQWKLSSASSYGNTLTTSNSSITLGPIVAGANYDVRARSVSTLGVRGAWSTVSSHAAYSDATSNAITRVFSQRDNDAANPAADYQVGSSWRYYFWKIHTTDESFTLSNAKVLLDMNGVIDVAGLGSYIAHYNYWYAGWVYADAGGVPLATDAYLTPAWVDGSMRVLVKRSLGNNSAPLDNVHFEIDLQKSFPDGHTLAANTYYKMSDNTLVTSAMSDIKMVFGVWHFELNINQSTLNEWKDVNTGVTVLQR